MKEEDSLRFPMNILLNRFKKMQDKSDLNFNHPVKELIWCVDSMGCNWLWFS